MPDQNTFENCEAPSLKEIKRRLLRARVAGEKLKHFDREDALQVLDELVKEVDELRARIKEVQTCPACGLQYTGIEAEDQR